MPRDADLPADVGVREGLKNLLKFTEELLATRDNVVFDISEYPVHLTIRDFLGEDGAPLPGITFWPADDAQSDGAWFSFARLPERQPPPPEAALAPWLWSEPHPVPGKAPVLRAERIVEVSAEEATDLIEAGLAQSDAVYPMSGEPPNATRWAVPLRPSELPEVTASLQAYITGPWRVWATAEAPRRKAISLYEVFFKTHARISAAGG